MAITERQTTELAVFTYVFAALGILLEAPHWHCCESPQHWLWNSTRSLATEAYPQWKADHPNTPCPPDVRPLLQYVGPIDIGDYDNPSYVIYCGPDTARSAGRFGVAHVGDDGRPGTDDDIRSWECRSSGRARCLCNRVDAILQVLTIGSPTRIPCPLTGFHDRQNPRTP